MKTVTLKDGQKAVQIRVGYSSRFGLVIDDTFYIVKRYGKLYVSDDLDTLQGGSRSMLHYYSNIIAGVKTFTKLFTEGGKGIVYSGYEPSWSAPADKWGANKSAMTVEIVGKRVKVSAPCGATLVLTQQRAAKLVEAVNSL